MPRLATFYGIVIYMYGRDHGVAHFHARLGDDEAVIEVATGRVLRGTLPAGRAKLVSQWAEMHRSELLEAWSRASNGEPPGTIEPLS
ncbi:MAG: DUF4160 domain-containing protein [Actinomycetota bacterium]|nr:DUF4160 domain-containing protein [Actinomycetota bacterium]